MADKRGVALILAMFVIVAIAIIMSAAFFGSINESNLLNRSIASSRALWLAEAGLAEAIYNLPNDPPGGYLESNPDYQYSVETADLGGDYYQVVSNGTVILANQNISRQIKAVLQRFSANADDFQYAIWTTVTLVTQGAYTIGCDPESPYCTAPYYTGPIQQNTSLNFADLFQITDEDLKSFAEQNDRLYTNPDNNKTPVDGVTYIDLVEDPETGLTPNFVISDNNWVGSGILFIKGNVEITGGTFNGMLYVSGELRMSGNPTINGAVLVESDTTITEDTTITGKVTLMHDRTNIENALGLLSWISSKVISWEEVGYNP